MSDKERLIIFDTTMRDGEQSPGASMTREEKLRIAKALERMRVDVIEAGFPVASQGDFEAVHAVAKAIKDSTVCGLARALERDIDSAAEALKGANSARIHTFLATSPIHMKMKLRMEPEQVLEQAVWAVRRARQYTDDVEFSPEDAGRSDIDFLCRVIEAVIDAGARTVNIPDTVGYNLPTQFGALIRELRERVPNSDRAVFSVHCHNDLGLAVANSLTAVLNGARQVECTINGLGERAGNASLEEVVMTVRTRQDMFPCDVGLDTTHIVPVSRLVSSITGFPVQPNKAIVGANAFAHESGIHQDGVLKSRETYEIMRAQDVGWSANRMVLGKHSGRNAFRARLKELGICPESEQELNAAFQRFKDLADKKHDIYDEDLQALITEANLAAEDELVKLVTHARVLGDRRDPHGQCHPAREWRRAPRQRAGQRPGRCHIQGHRCHPAQRDPVAAIFGEQHHQRHRCAGRGHGAAGEGRAYRERPGCGYRYRDRFRQGISARAEQDPGPGQSGAPPTLINWSPVEDWAGEGERG